MGITVTNVHGSTGTFYHDKQGAEEVSGILIGSESIYLDEVFRTDIATSKEQMAATNADQNKAANAGGQF